MGHLLQQIAGAPDGARVRTPPAVRVRLAGRGVAGSGNR
jgi:hypothetical protein